MSLRTDIAGVEDIDPFVSVVSGGRAVGERVMRSLLHSTGALWWAPQRGTPVAQFLHSSASPERIRLAIQREAEADPLVRSAGVDIEVDNGTAAITIALQLTDGTEAELEVRIDQLLGVLNASVTI